MSTSNSGNGPNLVEALKAYDASLPGPKSGMNPAELLHELADMSVEDIGSVVDALAAGAWDEWDCDFSRFVELFGAAEWKITAKSAAILANHWQNNPLSGPRSLSCADCEDE